MGHNLDCTKSKRDFIWGVKIIYLQQSTLCLYYKKTAAQSTKHVCSQQNNKPKIDLESCCKVHLSLDYLGGSLPIGTIGTWVSLQTEKRQYAIIIIKAQF